MKNITRASARMPKLPLIVAVSVLGMIFALLAGGNEEVVRAQTTTNTPTPAPFTGELPPIDGKLNPSKYPNMDTILNRIVWLTQSGQMLSVAATSAPVHHGESVAVSIHTKSDKTQDVLQWLADNGVDGLQGAQGTIEGYVPVDILPSLSALDGIIAVRSILPPQPAQSGAASEAIGIHGADSWHDAGVKGEGVKIGVIDTGFRDFGFLMGSELPNRINAYCFTGPDYRDESRVATPHLADCQRDDRGNHGTIVAESLYNIAPEAEYYIANPYSPWQVYSATQWMVSEGVDVINMSLLWAWDGPGDGTSPFGFSLPSTIATAVESDILWVNSAGNGNSKAWMGPYLDTDGDGFHNFEGDRNCNPVNLDEGQNTIFLLRWDDHWTYSDRDLDLLLFPVDASGNLRYAGALTGEGDQTGEQGHFPYEAIGFVPVESATHCLAVRHLSGETPGWIQLTSYLGNALTYATPGGSIGNPAEIPNPGLLAAGETQTDTPHSISEHSSRGPTPLGFVKPDITGVGGTFSEAGGGRILGTSIASPHVAGLAALVRQVNSHFTNTQTVDYLKNNALARGPTPNNAWGWGLAHLPPEGHQGEPPQVEPLGSCATGTAVANPLDNPGLVGDCETLLAARDILTEPGALNWSADIPFEDWDGVTVDGTPLRVSELLLVGHELNGNVPPELGSLSGLTVLDLGGNKSLTGSIPPELGNLVNLRRMSFHADGLTGRIPPELGNLVNLTGLFLNHNDLTGSIPPELANLVNLTVIHIGGNDFTGCIPDALRNRGIDHAKIGLPFCDTAPTPEPTPEPTPDPSPTPGPAPNGFIEVSVGIDHACALHSDGHIDCWGADDMGQASPPRGRFVQVQSGFKVSCAVREDGEVLCWGSFSVNP